MKTKSQSNRLGMYSDVRQILDTALLSGGGEAVCPNHGQAVHWRQRAYKFRKLFAETLATDDSFSMSPYDRLTMPVIFADEECKKRNHENCICSSTVVINVRESIATFTPNNEPYNPIDVAIPGDELFDVARNIAAKIKEGDL